MTKSRQGPAGADVPMDMEPRALARILLTITELAKRYRVSARPCIVEESAASLLPSAWHVMGVARFQLRLPQLCCFQRISTESLFACGRPTPSMKKDILNAPFPFRREAYVRLSWCGPIWKKSLTTWSLSVVDGDVCWAAPQGGGLNRQ